MEKIVFKISKQEYIDIDDQRIAAVTDNHEEILVRQEFNPSQLHFFQIYKCCLSKCRVVFGSYDKWVNVKMKAADAAKLKQTLDAFAPPYLKPGISKTLKHLGSEERLLVFPDAVAYVKRKSFGKNKFEMMGLKVSDILFFNQARGLFSSRLFFGNMQQIEMKSPDAKFRDTLMAYIKEHGAKIGQTTDVAFKSLFCWSKFYNPSYWFMHENIALNDNAMFYHRKTLLTEDSMCIPFSGITFITHTKGLFRRRIQIFGENPCVTKLPFRKSDTKRIIKRVSAYGVKSIAEGSVFQPSRKGFRWLKTWLIKDVAVIVNEDTIYVKPGKNGGLYNHRFNVTSAEELDEYSNERMKNLSLCMLKSVTDVSFKNEDNESKYGTLKIEFESEAIKKNENDQNTLGQIVILHISEKDARSLMSIVKPKE